MLICKDCNGNEFTKKGFKSGKFIGIKQAYKCKGCGSRKFPLDTDNVDEDILEENVKLAKSKQQAQDVNRIKNKSFRDYARIENAYTAYIKDIRDIIKEKDILPIKEHKITNPSAMIAHISDTHFNELVDLIGNKYDFKIASKRLYKFAERIALYAKSNNIKNIYLVMTGDLINSDRRVDERMKMSTNRAMASFLAFKLFLQFITDINRYANVNVISISGNESRLREEYSNIDELATDNFDFIIYEFMKLYMKKNKDNKGINFISGDNTDYLLKINGTTFLITHGMNMKKMSSTDVNKTTTLWANKGVRVNYILCGHLHETKIKDTLLRCGSMVGANDYSEKSLVLTSKASQNIHIIHENGDVDSIRVDLQDVPEDNNKMYNIDEDLEAYNAKSLDKTKNKVVIHEVVV